MLSFKERAQLTTNHTARRLFHIMDEKETTLSVACDVTHAAEFLKLAELIGDEICVLKTHIDILLDYTPEVTKELCRIAERKNFIIFEDRKFADIGSTVVKQYEGGIYKIAEWTDLINAHIIPGPGIIEGLSSVGLPRNQGLLLLGEMSSKGTLATGAYTQKASEMASTYSDFVIGFISLGKITEDPRFIHMTPGIQLISGKDTLGQQYQTPQMAVDQGTDIIIVGRDICNAQDPYTQAKLYKKEAWNAYAATK
ncbi:MAG: orotidine-5'-phosphate decarboxylase [Chlamydiota bacterium]